MIIGKITEGFGNQLFQYTAAWVLSKRLQQQLILFPDEEMEDRLLRLKRLNVSAKSVIKSEELPFALKVLTHKQVKSLFRRLHKTSCQLSDWLYFRQLHDTFQEEFFSVNAPNIFLDGYFQCESYFRE